MSELIKNYPKTYQTPTMAPFCKDEEKYKVVDEMVKRSSKTSKRIILKLIIN